MRDKETPKEDKRKICELEGYEDVYPYYTITSGGVVYGKNGHELKPYWSRSRRYRQMKIDLKCYNGRKQAYVHRLVGLAFIEGKSEKRNEIDHIDSNRNNNTVQNLRWVSHQENMDAYWDKVRKGEQKR